MTEAQMRELTRTLMKETTLDGSEALANNNNDIRQAATDVMRNAKQNGLNTDNNTSVSFSGDALKKAGINENGHEVVAVTTKHSLQEAKLNRLKSRAINTITKKDI